MQHHQRQQLTYVVVFTALCAQYSVLLMALSDDEEEAHRNELEVSALIDCTSSC
jgi:hypothetical protein